MRSAGIAMHDVAAVILAGGKSSRMGRDKALLIRSGKRLLDVVAEVIKQAGIEAIYVGGSYEGYRCIQDEVTEQGPMGGITACITRLSAKYSSVLFVPVDMPLLTSEVIDSLIRCGRDACHFEGHPLPCIIPLAKASIVLSKSFQHKLERGEAVAVKHFLSALQAKILLVPEHLRFSLTNTNTPEQWNEVMHESTHQ